MKCWICSRQSRGLRHADLRHRPSDPRHYPSDWVFCSQRCQDAFHLLYGNWTRAVQSDLPVGATMVDATPVEQAAMRLCLKFFGEAAGEIGFDKPLGAYTEAEALSVMAQVSYFKYTKKKYGEGRRILKMAPLHHHFEKSGWKETQVVVRFWIITMLLCLIGLSTLKLR